MASMVSGTMPPHNRNGSPLRREAIIQAPFIWSVPRLPSSSPIASVRGVEVYAMPGATRLQQLRDLWECTCQVPFKGIDPAVLGVRRWAQKGFDEVGLSLVLPQISHLVKRG